MIETKHAKSLGELSRGDAVEHPDHYAGDGQLECMDAMRSISANRPCQTPNHASSKACGIAARRAARSLVATFGRTAAKSGTAYGTDGTSRARQT